MFPRTLKGVTKFADAGKGPAERSHLTDGPRIVHEEEGTHWSQWVHLMLAQLHREVVTPSSFRRRDYWRQAELPGRLKALGRTKQLLQQRPQGKPAMA